MIINRFKPHMVKKGEMLTTDDIKHTLSLEIIAVIPDSEDIIVASNTGIPVSLNGNSRISKNFENLARRIRGEGVPLENDFVTVSKGFLDTLKDFFSKLKRG